MSSAGSPCQLLGGAQQESLSGILGRAQPGQSSEQGRGSC
jgi:hypothetical protein